MSEEILKALMQLFAIITKQDGGVTENERAYVKDFLTSQIALELVSEYLALYDKFAEYDKAAEQDKDAKHRLTSVKDSVRTLAICKKINKTLSQKQKVIALIRLFELLKSDNNFTEQRIQIIDTASNVFNIDPETHSLIQKFVTEDNGIKIQSEDVLIVNNQSEITNSISKHIYSHELDGEVLILHIKDVDMYFIKYIGHDELSLNGILINYNKIYLFAYGSTIRVAKSEPIFYSDIVSKFLLETDIPNLSFNVKNLFFRFPNGELGLRNINISEGPGKLIGIMGASGAGKTTLLNTLAGLEKPSEGTITVNSINIFEEKNKIEGTIGYIAQDDILIEELTVYQNLLFSAKLSLDNLPNEELEKRVLKVLENLGLLERKDLRVGSVLDKTISGGQRKRLNIAMELIREPDILFVDEPTSGLSSRDSENVMDLLKELTLKGKLIFVVIHQPSSDIYKMFDKMVILDTGGYQIFYGNPVEAVIHFKTATNQLNSQEGQCHHCGNVNPEQIFNIIETKVVDEYGNFTDKRRVNPIQWNEIYTEKIHTQHVKEEKDELPQNLFLPNKIKQWFIFTKRDVLSKISNKQYLIINLLEAPILAAILAFIVRYVADDKKDVYIFRENDNLPAFLFMSIIVAFFMGLTVSAEEIIKDRKLLKRERLLNLSRSSYLMSKIGILFTLSAIQTLLFVLVGNSILEIKGMYLSYWLVLFTISCYANMIGLNISASFNSVITIYILIPLLLIPQMILSGALFNFDKLNSLISSKERVPLIADMMASRWAFEAISVEQYKNNEFQKYMFDYDEAQSRYSYKQVYYIPKLKDILSETENLILNKKVQINDSIKNIASKNLTIISVELLKENQINKIQFEAPERVKLEHFDWELASEIEAYLSKIKEDYQIKFNYVNNLKDQKLSSFLSDKKMKEVFLKMKDEYTNDNLNDIMLNATAKKKLIEYNGQLVQKIDPIYQPPMPKNFLDYRTHFYSSKKYFLGLFHDTYVFNLLIIWISSIFFYIVLYFEMIRYILEMFGKISFSKK